MSNFPEELRLVRAELGLSQEQLASKLGVSFATVNRWETGKAKPQVAQRDALRKLLEESQLSLDEITRSGSSAPSR